MAAVLALTLCRSALPPFPLGCTGAAEHAADCTAWLAGTVWLWNGWAHVHLLRNGSFAAPNCAGGSAAGCAWGIGSDGDSVGGSGASAGFGVQILWGASGLHYVTLRDFEDNTFDAASAAASDSAPPHRYNPTALRGTRHDGDACDAVFVRQLSAPVLGLRIDVPSHGQRIPWSTEHTRLPILLRLLLATGSGGGSELEEGGEVPVEARLDAAAEDSRQVCVSVHHEELVVEEEEEAGDAP